MGRRAATGNIRVVSALLVTGMLIALAAVLLAACGGGTSGPPTPTASPAPTPPATVSPTPSAPASPSAPATSARSLYFLRTGKLGVAERTVAPSTMPATGALKALLAGPSASERAAGLSTAIPPGTRLRSLVISGGVAAVDLTQAPDAAPAGDAATMPGTAEVVYSLTHFRTVSSVRIEVAGQAWPTGASAGASAGHLSRADFRSFEPAIFVESPGVGAQLPDPFVLSGTASVYEGSFTAQLTDDAGRRVVRATLQASKGAPSRGSFRKTVVYSSSASHGTLTFYSQSAEDGSRQNVVTIPVTFAP